MKNLAIIPARGGSKRIPRKNIKDFFGKPIIAYSIETALKSGLFDKIMVSTDDEEIAEIAIKYGAKVPFMRSEKTSVDFASLSDVIEEVKVFYKLLNEKRFNYICCILPTAPLISQKNLLIGYELLLEKDVDSVRPLVRFSYPIQRAIKLVDNYMEMFSPEHYYSRTQDLEPAFHDSGSFYWMKFETGLLGKKKYGFEISELEAQDIDTEDDWKIAKQKYSYLLDNKSK